MKKEKSKIGNGEWGVGSGIIVRNLCMMITRPAYKQRPYSLLPTPYSLFFVLLFSLFSILFSLVSCDQPFKAGLGQIIDLQAPGIVVESPGAGAYIRGVTEFKGRASDDYKLDSVWFQLSNYPDVELPSADYKKMDHRLGKFYRIKDTEGDTRNITWKFKIDTARLIDGKRVFSDGDFMLRLLAIDSAGKETVTDEIAFFVKNGIPQISMAVPAIAEGTEDDGDLGSAHLNYNYKGIGIFPREMAAKGEMKGMISDNEGIYQGPQGTDMITDENGNSKTVELFPPQIRFWQVDFSGYRNPDADIPVYPYDELPPEDKVKWQKLGRNGVGYIIESGVNSLIFGYQLPDASGLYYGFQIRAQSNDKAHSSAHYPHDWYNFAGATADYIKENSYVLVTVRESTEYPTLELYKLEDIYGAGAERVEGVMTYKPLDIPEPNKTDGNYPYIDRTIASRNGPFTLRMKAYHTRGIRSAKVFWEKDDKSAKGRFIWDPVNDLPYSGWKGGTVSGKLNYNTWGRNEPDGLSNKIRSFVFTYYDDPAKDRIPNTDEFAHSDPNFSMRGKSKVQKYIGSDVGLEFDDLPEDNNNWQDMAKLDDGTYTISVYTTSNNGTPIAVPFTATIFIDRDRPVLELNYIEGTSGVKDGVNIVNGVIRPRFVLSDSRPEDTGFRTATSAYFKDDNGRLRSEQAYVLVKENDKNAMDNYFAMGAYLDPKKNIWPDFPASAGGALTIPGVTVSKHGPIFDSKCLFKTSKNYDTPVNEEDALGDGVYYLYVFARDNAFNVGRESFPIEVRLSSDDPKFDFSVGSVNTDVKEPDASFDTDSATGKSFIVAGGIRNKFSANSGIRVRIEDDDSLDLGEQGSYPDSDPKASRIKVEFSGSIVDPATGKIEPYDTLKLDLNGDPVLDVNGDPVYKYPDYKDFMMYLDDEVIKNAFTCQTLDGVERRPVKVTTGTINQTALLNELKKNTNYNHLFGSADKASFNSLPDHIYRVRITASDYSPAKLVMPEDTFPLPGPPSGIRPALVKSTTEEFWIAVDGKPPVIANVTPESGKYISPTGNEMKGEISDENGPITVTGWTVSDGTTVSSPDALKPDMPELDIKDKLTVIAKPTATDALWRYKFSFPMNMKGKEGTFTFEVKFKDRFGNSSTLTQRYLVDTKPPVVTLTRPIETFKRVEDDVSLDDSYIQLDKTPEGIKKNKERLAVKVISFSFGATDNFKISGIRWWLLPAHLDSDVIGFMPTPIPPSPLIRRGGEVVNYNAFPAKALEDQFPDKVIPTGTIYYGTTNTLAPHYVAGFDEGAFGVVDVVNRKFTIAVNTEDLRSPNGQYRLHIIAIDDAGNISRLTQDADERPASSLYQEIFLLQEEDKPYFDPKISPNAAGETSVIGANGLVVRGTIFENNGFFADQSGASLLPDSIRIWFSDNKDAETDPAELEKIVNGTSANTDYEGPVVISNGLGRQGRNLSLSIDLKEYFPGGFASDGRKHYIIKATDSPVNKLRPDGTAAASPADDGIRVSRWKHYAFTYDAVPPAVGIVSPEQGKPFGDTSFKNDFILGGYIEDANLVKTSDGKYYFEYYVDNDTANRKPFPLETWHITVIDDPAPAPDHNGIRVNFTIPASDVAATIIPDFKDIPDGPHTLTLVAVDLSGKDASVMYNFIKDVTPPTISFTNFIEDSKIYNADNKSIVAANWWTATTSPEVLPVMTPAAKLTWLRANPLTTIYYDPGSKPLLQGSFADDVSDIDIATFKYWIDDSETARTAATIDGSGRNVRWSIYLTSDGTVNGNPLPDGVHTIMLNVADTSGPINDGKFMIAFRIDSKPPEAKIDGIIDKDNNKLSNTVFGSPNDSHPDPVFTITGTANDANLEKMVLCIKDKAGNPVEIPPNSGITVVNFTTANNTAYTPNPSSGDNVLLNWSLPVTKLLYNSLGDGKSYDVIVVAYDYYGNKSEEQVWTFTVDKTTPAIEFTNPTKTNAVNVTLSPSDFIDPDAAPAEDGRLPEKNNINRLSSENLRIQGKVTDATSSISALQSRVWKWNWSTGDWDDLQIWEDIPGLNLADKRKEINWTKNLLGQNNTSSNPKIDLDLSGRPDSRAGQPLTPEEFADAEGLYRIQIRAKDESYTQNGTTNWTITTDRGNPAESRYLYFYYDRNLPELTVGESLENFYSTKLSDGNFIFSGKVTDNNRFAKVEMQLLRVVKGAPDTAIQTVKAKLNDIQMPDINKGDREQDWSAEISAAECEDGSYKIVVTAYDMTGKPYSITKTFTLDNTPPGAKFTLPAKVQKKGYGHDSENLNPNNLPTGFASVIVNGGESAVITGETWDKSDNNSESGLDQMWFHLGFIDTNAAFPSRADIEADEIRIIRTFYPGMEVADVEALSPSDRNARMDEVSEYLAGDDTDPKGNAWFKLGGTRKTAQGGDLAGDPVPVPTGFIINNPNIYDWRMEIPATHPKLGQIGGLKLYGSDIEVKGRTYSVDSAAALQMAQIVQGQAGIYRLPLWIRLVDKVGNVEYYCHDIWFYPDADIPTTTIFGADNGTTASARGGAISVDGEARSNPSVFHVAFRVFADGEPDTNLNGAAVPTLPSAGDVVLMPTLYDYVPITAAGVDSMYNIIKSAGYATTDQSGTLNSGWYYANLSLKGGAGEPLIPWSVILNADREITKLISSKGFSSSGGTKDMIRVWLEVFVFNGEGSPIRSSVYPNDGTTGANLYGTANAPKPYVRAFYVTEASPEITYPDVGGSWDGSKFVWNAPSQDTADPDNDGYQGAGTEVHRDKFAVRAVLDPEGSGASRKDLKEVSIRTKLNNDPYSTWTKVWENGSVLANNPGVKISVRNVPAVPPRTRYNFEYDIDSKTATTGFALLNNGNWANSGGTFTVQVRIKDSASNEAEKTLVVKVDNFAPVADINYRTNPKVAGTNVDFIGRVFDYATTPASDAMTTDNTPRKIARVYAWFTKNGQYVNMDTGERLPAPATGTRDMTALVGRKATVETTGSSGDTVTRIELLQANRGTPDTFRVPRMGSNESAHTADWIREISSDTAFQGSKMLWSPVNSADYDIRWSFTLNSMKLPDGELTLNYIVEDAVGNASYYTQTVSVRNNYPEIASITLYTDNDGQGAQYTQEDTIEFYLNDYRSEMFNNLASYADVNKTGYLNSGFISKNKYIGFKAETLKGNGNLNFRLQHVTRQRVKLDDKAIVQAWVDDRNAANNINLYTIAWHGDYSNANWRALGVPIDNPPIGTHFVLSPALDEDGKLPDDFKISSTAEVWKYTLVGNVKRNDITVTRPQDDLSMVAAGGEKDDRFEFKDESGTNNYFDYSDKVNKIGEYKGSHPDFGNGDVTPDDPDATAFFLIRVWDTISPLSGGYEEWVNEQLYDAVVVGMNVYLTDTTPPVARLYDLNPYTEIAVTGNNIGDTNKTATIRNAADPQAIGSNIVRGGLFNINTERDMVKSGYIDPRNGSFALDPKNSEGLPAVGDYPLRVSGDQVTGGGQTLDQVSGRIILRGLAQDDQLVGEIYVQIGDDSPKRILKLDAGKMVAEDSSTLAYAVETLHWKTGHTVEWAYVWDTEKEPSRGDGGGPLTSVPIQVKVRDKNGGLDSDIVPSDNNSDPFHNEVNVDIVPYITGFERETPKFTTKRSLQGWYSFFRGEKNIALRGYNFGLSGVTVNLNSTGIGGGTDIPADWNVTPVPPDNFTNTQNRFSFTMPNDAASGRLNVKVGSTDAYNHSSSNTNKSWNKESNSYTPGSDLWINKPYAHIWRSAEQNTDPITYIGTTSSSTGLDHPGMALEYAAGGTQGTLHGVWTVYGNANVYYGTNNNYSIDMVENTNGGPPNEPFGTADISIFNGGGSAAANAGFSWQQDGRPAIILKAVVTSRFSAGNGNPPSANQIQATTGVPTQRWQNLRISKAALNTAASEVNVGRIYMTAYNAGEKNLWFGTRGGPNANGTGTQSTATMYIDGPGATINSNNSGLPAAGSAGQYSAVDYDSTGPVIAYYDQTNDTVRVALGLYAVPTTAANQWNRLYLLPDGNPLFRGSGKYISIKVDKSNGIHLAFYNSVYNTVVYYYAESRAALGNAPDGTAVKAHAVDRVVTGGVWTDISVDNYGNPWIVYGDNSRTDNYDGARMAYRSGTTTGIQFTGELNCPVTGADITGWEALTMPAGYRVNNDRLNIEAWPPTNRANPSGAITGGPSWNAAIGYASDMYRVGYFYYPAWKGYEQ